MIVEWAAIKIMVGTCFISLFAVKKWREFNKCKMHEIIGIIRIKK
jgi:hypothetical protein